MMMYPIQFPSLSVSSDSHNCVC